MTPKKIRRVAVYARLSVSTEESVSIARQLEAARQYAAARGWTVVREAVDDGVSATKNKPEDRSGWRAILDADEQFEAVIVWKVDRLARRVLDFLHADEALQQRGAGLVAVEDPINMTTAQGRAFATLLAVFGEMEAAAISARVTDARRTLVRSGRRVGGRPPFGFRNVPSPNGPGLVLAHDPETIDAVRGAAERAAAGESLYGIARWLEASGVRPRARKGRKETPAPGYGAPLPEGAIGPVGPDLIRWNEASVETILRAPALAGMTPFTPNRKPGERVPADVLRGADGLPIVDESVAIMTPADWRAMLATLDAGKRPGSRPRAGAEVALLYGLARCESCGGLLHRASAAGGRYTYYRCQDRARGCKAPVSVSRPALEKYVVDEILATAGRLPVVRVDVEESDDPAPALIEIEAAISQTLTRLADVDDEDEEDRLSDRLRALKAARREARRLEVSAPAVTMRSTGETFAEALARAVDDVAARREILRSALVSVTVSAGSRGRTFDPSRVVLHFTGEGQSGAPDYLAGQID